MEITEIKVSIKHEMRLKGFANVTFDDAFVVRGLKIIWNGNRLFVAMPARKLPNGQYRDIAHPIKSEIRNLIESKVLEAYHRKMAETIADQSANL